MIRLGDPLRSRTAGLVAFVFVVVVSACSGETDGDAAEDTAAEDVGSDTADTAIDTGKDTAEAAQDTGTAAVDVGQDTGVECSKDSQCPKVGQCGLAACVNGQCTGSPAVGLCPKTKDPCTYRVCDAKTWACETALHVENVACDDGDPCTGTGFCVKGVCKAGAAKNCEDHKPCTVDSCTSVGGVGTCQHKPAPTTADCNDGQLCTVDDHCENGTCKAGKNVCDCTTSADCAGKGDGDKCKGELYCATTKAGTRVCIPNPTTKVHCLGKTNTACATEQCQPKTGKCELVALLDGKPCDDGKPETTGDACAKGECQSGAVTKCPSHDWCKAKHGDGDLCNGTLYCHKASGKCLGNPATIVACQKNNDTACRSAVCQPKTGLCKLENRPDGSVCYDGNKCTKNDACTAGSCKGGVNICPCSKTKECAPWEDGNLCNGTLYCDTTVPGKHVCNLNPATIVGCKTVGDTACIKTSCQPTTGQCATLQVTDGSGCDDGDKCTGDDACKSGSCQAGSKLLCECLSNADCALFEDGNPCNGTLFCVKSLGKCLLNPKTIVTCSAVNDTACTKAVCEPKSGTCGLKQRPDGADCSDGKACTAVAACKSGVCSATKTKPCDDANGCTKDVCDPTTGCVFTANNGAACDDGDACTKSSVCKNKGCISAAASCDDGNGCTKDVCDPKTGCVHTKLSGTAPCDDGDTCSVLDACSGGTCEGKPRLWTRALGTTGDDTATDIVALDDGSSIAVGLIPTVNDSSQGWMGRLDAGGKSVWTREIGGKLIDQLHDIARDGKQHVVVTGLADGSNTAGAVFVARYSIAGDQSWNAKFGTAKREWGRVIVPMPYGYAVGGVRYESPSNRDALVVALDSNHKQRWIRGLGGPLTEDCGGIAPMAGGRLAVMAMTTAVGGWLRPILWVLDNTGAPVWSRTWRLKESSESQAIIALANGDLLAAVYAKKGTSFRSHLWRLSTNGATRWEMVLDKKGHKRRILDLAELPGGNIAFSGNDHDQAGGGVQAWLGIVSPDGRLAQDVVIGKTTGKLFASGVDAAPGGGLVWAGEGSGQAVTGKGSAEIFVGTVDRGLGAVCGKTNLCTAPAKGCDDGNACTVDVCVAAKGCTHNAHTGRCDDGHPCTGHGACATGKCGKGKPLHLDISGTTKAASILDAVHLDGGGWIAVGERHDPNMKQRAWIGRFDANGKLLKTQIWGDGKSYDAKVRRIARWDADTVLVTITLDRPAVGADSATVIAFNRDLGSSMSVLYDDNHDDHFADVYARPSGRFFVAGSTRSPTNGKRWQGLVARFSGAGKLMAKTVIGTSSDETYSAIEEAPDGSYVVAGSARHKAPTDLQGAIVRVGADLKLHKSATFGGGGNDEFRSLASAPDGGFIVAGYTPNKGEPHAWLFRVDDNLDKVWQWVDSTWFWSEMEDIAVLTDGSIVTVQNVRKQSMTTDPLAALYRFDRFGNGLGGGRIPHGTSKTVTPIVRGLAIVEDHVVVVGRAKSGASAESWVYRSDLFSSGICTGKCAQKAATSCDDGNPCTIDSCNGDATTATCTHTDAKAGLTCGVGLTCAAGACK